MHLAGLAAAEAAAAEVASGALHVAAGEGPWAAGENWHSGGDATGCRGVLAEEEDRAQEPWAEEDAAATALAGHLWPTGLAKSPEGSARIFPATEASAEAGKAARGFLEVVTLVAEPAMLSEHSTGVVALQLLPGSISSWPPVARRWALQASSIPPKHWTWPEGQEYTQGPHTSRILSAWVWALEPRSSA